VNWTAAGDSKFGGSNINAIAYGKDKFVAGGAGGKMAYSTDGVNWTAVPNSTFGSSVIYAIAYGKDRWAAMGDGGKTAYSTDGVNWISAGAPAGSGALYAAASRAAK
jgi:hypothetical protein